MLWLRCPKRNGEVGEKRRNEENKNIWEEKRGNLETLGKVKRSGGGDEENDWHSG